MTSTEQQRVEEIAKGLTKGRQLRFTTASTMLPRPGLRVRTHLQGQAS